MLPIFDEVGAEAVRERYPNYIGDIVDEIHVRIAELPVQDSLRELRTIHLNALIRVAGVVTRRTSVFPMLSLVKFKCGRCSFSVGPFAQNDDRDVRPPAACPECQREDQSLRSMRSRQCTATTKNHASRVAGNRPSRPPRYKDVILLSDLIDRARPGEEIEVTGVYTNSLDRSLNSQQGFPVFSTCIEANYVQRREEMLASNDITDDEKRQFRRMARDSRIAERIIGSVAPSIYGCEHVKTALCMSFWWPGENINYKHRIRGDINVLLLGDPGTAKSQCLKWAETAPRSVYTTGKGASAVGLTAAVHKDPVTREWTLEGGALVLAIGACASLTSLTR